MLCLGVGGVNQPPNRRSVAARCDVSGGWVGGRPTAGDEPPPLRMSVSIPTDASRRHTPPPTAGDRGHRGNDRAKRATRPTARALHVPGARSAISPGRRSNHPAPSSARFMLGRRTGWEASSAKPSRRRLGWLHLRLELGGVRRTRIVTMNTANSSACVMTAAWTMRSAVRSPNGKTPTPNRAP
jgi:hypothetical protein